MSPFQPLFFTFELFLVLFNRFLRLSYRFLLNLKLVRYLKEGLVFKIKLIKGLN